MAASFVPSRAPARTAPRLLAVLIAVIGVTSGLSTTLLTAGAAPGHVSGAVRSAASEPARVPAVHPLSPSVGVWGPPGDNWTSFMGGPNHSSYQSVSPSLSSSTAGNLSLQWSYQSGGVIVSEPIVADNRVYFGAWNGDEYALDANNGSPVWSTFTGQSQCQPTSPHYVGVTSTAALTPTALYFGGGKDYWEAVAPGNGTVLWKIYTGNSNGTVGGGYYNWASPLLYDGYAYIGLSSHCDNPLIQGQLLKVNLTTHAVVGVFNTTTPQRLGATIWSSPAINASSGTIYFATGNLYACCGTNVTLDDSILAVNASTMNLTGRFQVPYGERVTDGDFGASVTLFTTENGTPMVGDDNKDGLYFALNQSNLSRGALWTDRISLIPGEGSAAFAHGSLFVGSARTTVASGAVVQGAVRSINATTGTVNWERAFNGNVYGPAVVAGDVVVAAGGKELAVLSVATGAVLWRYNSTAQFYGGPTVAGGRIYIGDVYGKVYCFGYPLSAQAGVNVSAGDAPLKIAFHGGVFGGEAPYNFSWSFGDGHFSGLQDPRHTYALGGTYTATERVADAGGVLASSSITVLVSTPVVQTIPVGTSPSAATYDPVNGYEYVANSGSDNVSILDGTELVRSVPVGTDPVSIVVDPVSGEVYVANYGSANVTVLQGTVYKATIAVGPDPQGMTYARANDLIYVPTAGNVSLLSGTSVLNTTRIGVDPTEALYDKPYNLVYVTNAGSDNVSVLRGPTVIANLTVGTDPTDLTVNPNSGRIYVANTGSDNVSVIAGSTVTATVALGASTGPLTFDPSATAEYVALAGSDVGLLGATTLLSDVAVGSTPGAAAYADSNGFVYVPNAGSDNVTVLNGSEEIGSVPVGSTPTLAAYDPSTAYVYVLDSGSASVSAILTYHDYPVNFTETGLAPGTTWTVNLTTTYNSGVAGPIGFAEPNGTYGFEVAPVPGYLANRTSGTVTVNGSAATVAIAFTPANFSVSFVATGLPAEAVWSVDLNGSRQSGTADGGGDSTITFSVPNGDYVYTIGPPPFSAPNVSGGSFHVADANVTIDLSFHPFNPTFAIDFEESGLPVGRNWSVDLAGDLQRATIRPGPENGSTITFSGEANGSFHYNLSVPLGYDATPAAGTVVVDGQDANVSVVIGWSYPVQFLASGLPAGGSWSVRLGGQSAGGVATASGDSRIAFNATNGTFAFAVIGPAGYRPSNGSGQLSVRGSPVTVNESFARNLRAAEYSVFFRSIGLPNGTEWGVELNGTTLPGFGEIIFTGLANGSYGYSVLSVQSFAASPVAGTIVILGGNVSETISFQPIVPPGTPGTTNGGGAKFLGLPATEGYVVAAGAVAVGVGIALAIAVRGRRGGGGGAVTPQPSAVPPDDPA